MKEVKFALKQTFPIMLTYVFLGTGFGILMSEAGYNWLYSTFSAIFIYAGSMQIVMVGLLKAHVSLLTVVIMCFFINGRHLFYGLNMLERYRNLGLKKVYMIFSLTDETFSVLSSVKYPSDLDGKKTDFLISLFDHSYWIIGCFIGSLIKFLPIDLTGIDFSATAFFVIVAVENLISFPSKLPLVVGLISSIVFLILLGPDYFIIPTMTATVVILIMLRKKLEPKVTGGTTNE